MNESDPSKLSSILIPKELALLIFTSCLFTAWKALPLMTKRNFPFRNDSIVITWQLTSKKYESYELNIKLANRILQNWASWGVWSIACLLSFWHKPKLACEIGLLKWPGLGQNRKDLVIFSRRIINNFVWPQTSNCVSSDLRKG